MLFDSSTRSELAKSFGVTLVVVLTIVLTSMLIRNVGQAAGGNVAPQDVVLLMGYATLSSLAPILALSLFVAVILTLGRLYRESEMTIWFASGIPLSSFVKPVLGMAWPVLLAVIVLELIVWPWGNRNSAELLDQYQKRGDLSRVAPGRPVPDLARWQPGLLHRARRGRRRDGPQCVHPRGSERPGIGDHLVPRTAGD